MELIRIYLVYLKSGTIICYHGEDYSILTSIRAKKKLGLKTIKNFIENKINP